MRDRSSGLLVEFLRSKTVVELDEIRIALGHASRATAFRYLKQVAYRRSYNFNGRYYTLHDPARYDRFGLWSRGGIHFSVDGSLRNTVRRLVREAEAGATHRELHDRLLVRVQNTLVDLLRKGEVDREQLMAAYVYLHVDAVVRDAQVERRRRLIASEQAAVEELTDEVVIAVLLTLIRHPGSQPAAMVRRFRGHSPPISRRQIDAVFTRYALGEKGGSSKR